MAPAERGLHAADALIGHPLHEAHIKAHLVPLDDGALDLEEGQADRGLCAHKEVRQVSACGQRRFERPPLTPRLRGLEDEVVQRVTD